MSFWGNRDIDKELEPHQVVAKKLLVSAGRGFLYDDMGLGKSLTALCTLKDLHHNPTNVLILCGKSALSVWPFQISLWFPHLERDVTVIKGMSTAKRLKKWAENTTFKVVTYETMIRDWEHIIHDWDHVIMDEIHRVGRNHKSARYKFLQKLRSPTMTLLTGTPLKRGVQDFYGYFKLLYPKRFTSYWKFVYRYTEVSEEYFGKHIGGPRNQKELGIIMSKFAIGRKLKLNVDLIESFLPVYFDGALSKLMTALEDELIAETENALILVPTAMTSLLRIRQMFVTPKLLDPHLSIGPGLEGIIDHIQDNEIERPIIFTPFPSAFKYLTPHLEQELGIKILELRGGMDHEEVDAKIKEFWANPKTGILCSIQFAQSFDLTIGKCMYFLGYEHDHTFNEQAKKRVHRMNSKHNVNCFWVRYPGTVDHHLWDDIVQVKIKNTGHVYRTGNWLKELAKRKQEQK